MSNFIQDKRGFVFLFKVRVFNFLRSFCFRFKNFLHAIEKDMCFTKKEKDEIKSRVKNTIENDKKFEYVKEEFAPKINELVVRLRSENETLKREKEFCIEGIKQIYLADTKNDIERKKELFKMFGLPYVLEIEKMKKGE